MRFCPAGLQLQEPRQVRKEAALTVIVNAYRVAESRKVQDKPVDKCFIHPFACLSTYFLVKFIYYSIKI